mmetsp:Transcript_38486/g.101520  ORF Transcript_38486/g.101520 Transcript_38486/m.101520 type:complete len:291 (-) Transcript_38486:136-1008(-)
MLKALVVRRPEEDVSIELAPGVPVVHPLEASLLVAKVLEEFGDLVDGDRREGRRVALVACERRDLGEQTLDQVADGHARGDGVRVDDDVGRDALARERHVLLALREADRSLLPVARRKLVANLRDAHRADAYLDELAPFLIGRQEHLVHVASLRRAERRRRVASRELCLRGVHLLPRRPRRRLADDDVVARDAHTRRHQAIVVELRVVPLAQAVDRLGVRLLEALSRLLPLHVDPVGLALLVAVRAVEDGAEEAAVDRRLVHDHRVLLVVARVARDRDRRIDAGRKFAEV